MTVQSKYTRALTFEMCLAVDALGGEQSEHLEVAKVSTGRTGDSQSNSSTSEQARMRARTRARREQATVSTFSGALNALILFS